MSVPGHAIQGDDVAMEATPTRVTRLRSAEQAGTPLSLSNAEMTFNNSDQSKSSGTLPTPNGTSLKDQYMTVKRKADALESPSESVKAPRIGNGQPAKSQSLRQRTIMEMYGDNTPKRETPGGNPLGSPDGGGGGDSSESASDMEPRSTDKPLRSLREIVQRMMDDASQTGLGFYTASGRQYYIRVGTLCSGTDAPVHVMNLFQMLKNSAGDPVFTTINCFGCEIEPYKQSFLMRNSKPELLFKDAKDFADGDAERA